MSRLGSYKNTAFNESQKFLVLDPSTSTASLVLASELVAYITPQIGSVKAESTRLSAENTDYKVGELIQTSGATVVGSLAAVYLVVAGGAGDFPMLNGNDLLVLIGDDALRAQLISQAAGQGASRVSMEGGPTVEAAVTAAESDILNRVIRVSSRTEMKAYNVPAGYQFSLKEGKRSGLFVKQDGTAPEADPLEGIYVVADSGGYYERVDKEIKFPQWWGAVGDGVEIDDAALQAWLDQRGYLFAPVGDYLHLLPLYVHTGTTLMGAGPSLSSDIATRFTKQGTNATGGANASFIFGDNVSVQYCKLSGFEVESDGNADVAFWSGLRGANLEIANTTLENIVIRNHQRGTHFELAYLMEYRKVNMGGGVKGFFVGYNNSTSNHFYNCYTNQTAVGYHVNSLYSSLNGCAADGATDTAYYIGNGATLNSCAAEFPVIAVKVDYSSVPAIINKMLVICRALGTTLCQNYGPTNRSASAIFNDCDFSANTAAKSTLVVVNAKGDYEKERYIQFINSPVGTYVVGTDNTVFTNLWNYPSVIDATAKYVGVYYGPSKKQIIVSEAFGVGSIPNKNFVLTRVSTDGDYEISYNQPLGSTTYAAAPEAGMAKTAFLVNGGNVALINSYLFHSSQNIRFYSKTGDSTGIFVQYEQLDLVGTTSLQVIAGGTAERRYPLEQIESPGNFTLITPYPVL
jgi:hypothetical protein